MGVTTRKISQNLRPRKPSAKARANSSKISQSEPKPHASKKFIHPNDMDKEPMPEPSEPPLSPIEMSVDVSHVKYNLAMSCMLGTAHVFTDTKKFKLKQFQLQDFTGTIIKKLAKAANPAKYKVEWDSATAVISADRFGKAGWISVDIEEDTKWKVIEEWIQEFMIKKRINITVKLVVIYRKIVREELEVSDEDTPVEKGGKV